MMRKAPLLIMAVLFIQTAEPATKALFAIRGYSNQSLTYVNLQTGQVRDSIAAIGDLANALVVRNQKLYVVNSGGSFSGLNASIKIYSIADIINNVQPLPVVTVPVPDFKNPYDMVFVNDSKAYISYLLDSSVVVFNAQNNTLGQRIQVGPGPEGMAVANNKLYVANAFNPATLAYGTTVSVITTTADTVLTTLTVYSNPQAIGVDNLGRPHVVSTGPYDGSGRVTVFNPATDAQIGTVLMSADISDVAFTSANIAYTSSVRLLSYNATTLDTIRTGNNPYPIGGGSLIVHRDTLYIAGTGRITLYNAVTRDSLAQYSLTSGALYFGIAIYDDAPTDAAENNTVPSGFRLEQNYPNPFNPATTIRYAIPPSLFQSERVSEGQVRVSLKVYDLLGRVAATLVDGDLPAGSYQVLFDASHLASGVYFYQLRAGSLSEMKKMMVLR